MRVRIHIFYKQNMIVLNHQSVQSKDRKNNSESYYKTQAKSWYLEKEFSVFSISLIQTHTHSHTHL